MEEEKRKKSLEYSIKDGVAWSVNEALGAYYVSPFAIALGASEAQIGLLTSVPNLAANLSQLATPRLMEGRSRKKLVTELVFMQAMVWLPMSILAMLVFLTGVSSTFLPLTVMLFYAAYLTLGALNGPAWASWIGDLVSEEEMGSFFGRRNRIIGFANLIAFMIAGIFLDLSRRLGVIFPGFSLLFLGAMLARLISRYFLLKHYEPKFEEKEEYHFGFFEFLRKIWRRGKRPNRFGRFSLYTTLMAFATNIAAPFFAVYMLRDLKFSYITYVAIVLSSSSVRFLSMVWWGKFSDRYGRLRTLRIGGLLIPWVPILWLLTTNPIHLSIIEMFGGFAWAAFDLASFTFVYDVVSREKRGICFSYFNALNGMGIFAGATLGGLFATKLSLGLKPILSVFLLSGILRLVISLLLLPHLSEVKKVKPRRPLWTFPKSFVRRRFRI
ncbi:MAG: MFS transporter [Candidatus Hadarchaeales archaeon]